MISATEPAGFVLALAMVFCSIGDLHWTWLLASARSVLNFGAFRDSHLDAEASLQRVFVALALWGWWQRQRRARVVAPLQIRRLRRGRIGLTVLAALLLWPDLTGHLNTGTDGALPWWDALPVAVSLTVLLLGRKYLDNRAVGVRVHALGIGLCACISLWLSAPLYARFPGLRVAGGPAWRHQLEASLVNGANS